MNHRHCTFQDRCPAYAASHRVDGVCLPEETPELRAWVDARDRGEAVGRAPAWACPHYTGPDW